MSKLIECVPNFSEGRRPEVLRAILSRVEAVPGATILDHGMDPDHNRAVVTFVGPPRAVREAAFAAIATATELIDLTSHQGEHPRIGATDVVPFVPLAGATMKDCAKLAAALGEEVAARLGIPVYLYEHAARRPERRNLADIRRGGFEALRDQIGTDPRRAPDFGPARVHPTAGAVAIGARSFLIAYNVELETDDLAVAKEIARAVRESSGGLAGVKALGFHLKERGIVQVSMNLVDLKKTSMARVFRRVERLARARGVRVRASEIVGLVPEDAVFDATRVALKLVRFGRDSTIEDRLRRSIAGPFELQPFLDDIASTRPAPGGGAAAGLAGALAAAVAAKVVYLTLARERYAAVHERFESLARDLEAARWDLLRLVERDGRAYAALVAALRAPAGDDAEKAGRAEAIAVTSLEAARVPLEIVERSALVARIAAAAGAEGNPNLRSDAATAIALARGAVEGAAAMVLVNLPGIADRAEADRLAARARELGAEVDGIARKLARP